MPTGPGLLQNACSLCPGAGDPGQQAPNAPAAVLEHRFAGIDEKMRMLALPFDHTCGTVEGCLDLHMSSNQRVGCGCPLCQQPTARHRRFRELPNTLLLQIQLLNGHGHRRDCQVQHNLWHSLHDCLAAATPLLSNQSKFLQCLLTQPDQQHEPNPS